MNKPSDRFRAKHRELSPLEAERIQVLKDRAAELQEIVELLPPTRERSLAETRLEEAVMWAVKAATR